MTQPRIVYILLPSVFECNASDGSVNELIRVALGSVTLWPYFDST